MQMQKMRKEIKEIGDGEAGLELCTLFGPKRLQSPHTAFRSIGWKPRLQAHYQGELINAHGFKLRE
jgi:hypothetical protein